ncbi:restriction endonuclease subunit S [Nocardia rhamnosiphila]
MSLNLDKSSWKRVSFGDVARHVTDRVAPETSGLDYFLAGEHISSGSLAITDRGVIGRDPIGPMFYKRFKPGHVLYVSRRTYLRKVAVPEFEGITGEKTFVLESSDSSALLQEFLPFVLSSEAFHGYAIQNSRGSVNPYLNWGELVKYEFDLPPLDEQKRIADVLWSMEKHRLKLFELISKIRRVASAMVSDCRSESAAVVPLGSVANVRNGQPFPRSLQGKGSGDIPFFKVGDLDAIENLRWLTRPSNWISAEDAAEIGARLVPAGAIITVRVGAALRLERRRMLKQAALVDDNHLIITPSRMDGIFLWAVLSEISLGDNRNDGVVPSINQKIVRAIEVPDVPREYAHAVGIEYMRLQETADSISEECNALRGLQLSLISVLFGGD